MGPRVTPGKVFGWSNFQKFVLKSFYFCKMFKMREKILWNPLTNKATIKSWNIEIKPSIYIKPYFHLNLPLLPLMTLKSYFASFNHDHHKEIWPHYNVIVLIKQILTQWRSLNPNHLAEKYEILIRYIALLLYCPIWRWGGGGVKSVTWFEFLFLLLLWDWS